MPAAGATLPHDLEGQIIFLCFDHARLVTANAVHLR
jgi:hypothetical protein